MARANAASWLKTSRTFSAGSINTRASVSDLARPLPITLQAVVQHLAVLESSGLIRSEKAGRVRTCQINPQALREAERWIGERRTLWERRLDRLGRYFAEEQQQERRKKEEGEP